MPTPPRLFIDQPLGAHGQHALSLPPAAARHVQVLRLQPGEAVTLFDGHGGEWHAVIERIGRRDITVSLHEHVGVSRESTTKVTIALGMPANERMDTLVEKATELGAAAIQPLVCERSVLRLSGERAQKKAEHWQRIAAAAAEQSGRTRVPPVTPAMPLAAWLASLGPAEPVGQKRLLLSPRAARPLVDALPREAPGDALASVLVLSGPEGGLSDAEEAAAQAAGFVATGLGARVLRADTAPLAVLAVAAAFDTTREDVR